MGMKRRKPVARGRVPDAIMAIRKRITRLKGFRDALDDEIQRLEEAIEVARSRGSGKQIRLPGSKRRIRVYARKKKK